MTPKVSKKSGMKHCNNHLKLLNNILYIKEIQQKEREAGIDTNGQN